jgi:N-carbamoylputrescine amidase
MNNTLLRIALLQLASHQIDQAANLQKGELYCRQAKAAGADIALFPEMWNIGYSSPFAETELPHDDWDEIVLAAYLPQIKKWQAHAITQDSDFVKHFQNLARELNMAIAITYLEKYKDGVRNSLSLIDRHGVMLFTYAKVHTCDCSPETACTPGDNFYVAELDTEKSKIKIGAMICYDREFPESARILMLKGAEIILTPNACNLEQNRLAQFQTRAFENMVGVAMANYAQPQNNGHSCAFDGMPFDRKGRSRDMLVAMGGENEGIVIADFNIEKIRTWRQTETWGNAYRKPRCYKDLISLEVQKPFIRKNARR